MRPQLLLAAIAVLGGASAPSSHPEATPMLLPPNRIMQVEGTRIYCTVQPLLHLGNELYCYDARDRLVGSYAIELTSSQLTVLRFAEADKAHIVWARREP